MTDGKSESYGGRSVRGVLLSLFTQALIAVMQIAYVAALARLLNASDFGVAAIAVSIVAVVNLFTNFGLTTSAIQAPALDQNLSSALFAFNVLVGALGLALVALIAVPVSRLFGDDRVVWAMCGLGVSSFISAAATQHYAILSREMSWGILNATNSLSLAANVVAGVGFAWSGWGYFSIIAGLIVASLVKLICCWLAIPWRPTRVTDWAKIRPALAFGAGVTSAQISLQVTRQIDVLLIGWYWGAAEAGYYSRAFQLIVMPLSMVFLPMGTIFVPVLSRVQAQPSRWAGVFRKIFVSSCTLGGLIAAIFIVTGPELIRIVYGPGWDRTIEIFYWLSWTLVFSFPMTAASWAFVSLGKTRQLFIWGLVSLLVLAPTYLATFWFGSVALAQGLCFALVLLTPVIFLLALNGTLFEPGEASLVMLSISGAIGSGILAGELVGNAYKWGVFDGLVAQTTASSVAYVAMLALLVYRRASWQEVIADARTMSLDLLGALGRGRQA